MPEAGALFCPLCSIALDPWVADGRYGLDCHNCELTWHEDEDGNLFRCTCFANGSVPLELAKPGLGVSLD